jgi:large subunit ribosomal protein L25
MKSVVVKGQKREAVGKKESKKLRAQEIVPAVLYGGKEPIHFAVPFSELRKLVYTPSVYLIDLDIEGQVHKAIMQDVQWHVIDEQILHIDFLSVLDDKPIKIDIPVTITGLAKGIKMGGKLNKNLRRLKVKALAKDLPDTISIDVTKLEIGQSIKVSEVDVENIELLDTKTNVIVSVNITRAAKSAGEGEDVDEELEEGAEGAEETPAEATE